MPKEISPEALQAALKAAFDAGVQHGIQSMGDEEMGHPPMTGDIDAFYEFIANNDTVSDFLLA